MADAELVRGAGPEGTVRVSSPGSKAGRGARRDSGLARRHAFHFPFDFMLAAGSSATVRWGPAQVAWDGGNTFHWLRPEDFDATDVVVVSRDGEELGQPQPGAAAAAGAAPVASLYSRAGATLGGWQGGGGNGAAAREDDPDAPLRAGAMCLVDPNGTVSHTIPLMAGGVGGVGASASSGASRSWRSWVSSPEAQSGGAGGGSSVGFMSPVPSPQPHMSLWNVTTAAALATPRRLAEKFGSTFEPSGRRWGSNRPLNTPLPEPRVPDSCILM